MRIVPNAEFGMMNAEGKPYASSFATRKMILKRACCLIPRSSIRIIISSPAFRIHHSSIASDFFLCDGTEQAGRPEEKYQNQNCKGHGVFVRRRKISDHHSFSDADEQASEHRA